MTQPLAHIHPNARIGKNVTIEPFVTIQGDVIIGDNTWIGPNAVICDGARIGNNCQIHAGAVISNIPQDLKFKGETTTTEIGDNTIIREFVTINRGTIDKYKTVIGANCLIMAYVHVAHDCSIGNHCILVNSVQLAGHVEIDDFAIIGGTSAVLQFVRIGKHTMIAGGSLVRKDVPHYTRAAHEPIAYSGLNIIGLRRRGFNAEKIAELQEIYRLIYMNGQNTTEALKTIEAQVPASEERDEIIEFVRNSKKGIMRGSNKTLTDDINI
jgi:UDP-N-acetylglucosamine acyltransferase